jgi:hypothetical protein
LWPEEEEEEEEEEVSNCKVGGTVQIHFLVFR